MTLEQLKAAAYDCLVQIASWQRKLAELESQMPALKPAEPPK